MSPSTGDKRKRGDTDNSSGRDAAVSPPPVTRRNRSDVSQKAVADFFKPASQKQLPVEKVIWRIVEDSLLVAKYNAATTATDPIRGQPVKIAAFDFDATLVTPSSGLRHSRDASDWKWWHNKVPGTLERLHQEGYHLVILSNQAGITLPGSVTATVSKTAKSDNKRYQDFRRKVNSVLAQLDLPITLYAATERDRFRKPRTGMWIAMLDELRRGQAANAKDDDWDVESSVFVGDAGGRTACTTSSGASLRRDFSISDRNFAANIGITYKTPEEFFLDEAPRHFESNFDPMQYLLPVIPAASDDPTSTPVSYSKKNKLEVVLLVGSPGAGKSTFYWQRLKPLGYERVNQDILKSRDRCVAVAKAHLSSGKSVAVDNTNATPDVRSVYVKLAQALKIPIRCINLTTPISICEHNDAIRAMHVAHKTLNPESRMILPSAAFGSFHKRYIEPKVEEGFQDIRTVDFVFHGSDEDKEIWSKYWA